jgi:2-polyprenyl-3-methyl-5-hydroxy-6-metoxy-1,4-benzoquinol methylase
MSRSGHTAALAHGDDWDAHWSDYAAANARNPAQDFRRRLVLRLAERDRSPRRLVDIGSGTGVFLEAAAARWPGAELMGLELSEWAVAAASASLPQARFRACDLTREQAAPHERAWATDAVCSEVLEHLDDPVTVLRNARTWLAPGCRVIVTVPGGPMSAFDRHIGHRRHFTAVSLGETLSAAGLEVEAITGAGFPFFNLYRALVIARGDRLITDASADPETRRGRRMAWTVMAVFGPLLRVTLRGSRYGWQMVAIAREPR